MQKWIIGIVSMTLAILCVAGLVLVSGGMGESPTATTASLLQHAQAPSSQPTEATQETVAVFVPMEPPDMSQSTATHLFVYDAGNERMLYTLGDQTQRIAPASLTKLFTAWVAVQYLDPGDMLTVGEEAGWIAADSSIAAVSEGCRLSAGMILQGMLMQSGNDAAYAIAVAAGRAIEDNQTLAAKPAYEIFINEMNRQLQEQGFTNTHFANPDGYHHDDHYTTAQDLLGITRLAMSEPLIREYCGIEKAVVHYESGEEYTWQNTNWLLRQDMEEFYCPEATGLKTGSTSAAGMCLIASFRTEKTTLIIGVLGCEEIEQRFADALALFAHYR